MRRTRMRVGVSAILLACLIAGALLSAGPASAASRGFTVYNHSNQTLVFEGVRKVPTYVCADFAHCVPSYYRMDFEGRPAEGAVLHPGDSQRFELKYGFSLVGGVQYAALLGYRIGSTDHTVEYRIEVYSTSNESSCKVDPAHGGTCTAQGVTLTFK